MEESKSGWACAPSFSSAELGAATIPAPTFWHSARNEIERLHAIATECRSSVKFDLLHYEKMARAYGNLGAEGAQTAATAEAEAQRLHCLLEKIDALTLTTPNAEVNGVPLAARPSEAV